MRRLAWLCGAAAAALSSGCFTTTNLKTGETTPPGRLAWGVGVTSLEGNVAPMFDTRIGVLDRWDIGMRYDALSLCLETRIQILKHEENGLNGALEVGEGLAVSVIPRPFVYGGFCASWPLEGWEPYVHFRYIDIAMLKQDAEDEGGSWLADLILYMPPELDEIWQVSLGAALHASDKLDLIPEVMVCPTLTDEDDRPLVFLNVALRFRFW